MPVAHAEGADLYYEMTGAGPRLLLVNGSGTTLEDGGLMAAAFSPRFEVLAFDYRGLGRSSEVVGAYTMAECAADAMAVMDAAGWDTARMLGISFGGMVALELAVTCPARVERLVLLCTSAGGGGGSSFPLHQLAGLVSAERLARRPLLLDTRFDRPWLDSHPADRSLVAMMAGRTPEPDHPRRDGYSQQLEARRTHDTWDRLPAITCPTFIGCGRYDGIAPMANSEAMASRIGAAELHVYEGGHAFLAQAPESFDDITGFLLRG